MSIAADPAGVQLAELRPTGRQTIWIDLDNSPHVPFFRPIIEELRKRDHNLLVTAQDAYQVRELLEYYRVSGRIVADITAS